MLWTEEHVGGGKTYRTQEFARLAGVTVRALHHYDRIGLLKPGRTLAGHRVYGEHDLARLEQIVALKFIGVPLKSVRSLLDRGAPELLDALRVQRRALEEKRRLLDGAIGAICEAEVAVRSGAPPAAAVLQKIIEVMEMQSNSDWMMKYFREEAQDALAARKAAWTPELQAQAERDWSGLFRDIESALDEDPSSPRAQALVDRWNALLQAFIGGDLQLVHGVKALYANRAAWPESFREQMAPFTDERVWEFYRRAVAARVQAG